MRVMGEMDPNSLTNLQKRMAMQAIKLIKFKKSAKLNGKTCAYGRPQRCYIHKEDLFFPNHIFGSPISQSHN